MNVLLVFFGAGLGGALRHAVNAVAARSGASFPWGTMAINIGGSLLMGIVVGWFAARGGSPAAKLFLATGILGGFTTFSTFSLEGYMLIERGAWAEALAYIVGSVLLGLGGLIAGLFVMRHIL